MKFRYWTITLEHDPTLLDRQGLGIVVEDADGATTCRLVPSDDIRSAGLTTESLAAARTMLGVLREDLQPLTATQPVLALNNDRATVQGLLNTAVERWNNFVRVQPPRILVADMELGEAADFLFSTFIRRSGVTRSRWLEIRNRVVGSYRSAHRLEPMMYENPSTTFGGDRARTDLAIIDSGQIHELVRAIPFDVEPDSHHVQSIEAWTLRVLGLRNEGGTISAGAERFDLAPDSAVTVIFAPPKTKQQCDVYESISRHWTALGIESIPASEAEEHAREIALQVVQGHCARVAAPCTVTRMTDPVKKKLIEVSLPLEKINAEASREKSIRHGHPSTLHLYWARRPLAAARAVLFAQLVDDPSAHPEKFPTIEEQDAERDRLHKLIEELVVWENSNDEKLLEQAREEIRNSNNGELPAVLDPFAGGGAIPLEAQRLGLEAHASDLNPLAVLINKALIELPPKFKDMPPVFPGAAETRTEWKGAEGLAEDVRLYGQWMRDEAEKRIGHLYPKVKAPGGTEHTVIAWIWARTVRNPNPANPIEVPLVRSWWLSKKKGKEAWVEAKVVDGEVRYEVRHDANGPKGDADGTVKRTGAVSIADGTPIDFGYVRQEAKAGRMGSHLIGIVGDGKPGRIYCSPEQQHVEVSNLKRPSSAPEIQLPEAALGFRVQAYGFETWADLFTNRQLLALTTFSALAKGIASEVERDARNSTNEVSSFRSHHDLVKAYADAVTVYLALAVSKSANVSSSFTSWMNDRGAFRETFARQALPMVWDYAEQNPLLKSGATVAMNIGKIADVIENLPCGSGEAQQADAMSRSYSEVAISTDPPYYDNIGYSDLSDYFYVWIRPMLENVLPGVTSTILTPKADELVANPFRHGGRAGAERFFVDGFDRVFEKMRSGSLLDGPITVYYAYKQQDVRDTGTASTGWHTLLDGLMKSGWEITATWPMRTEGTGRILARGTNALASSIVLACRPRPEDAPLTTRRDFTRALKKELPDALRTMLQGSIAPVDLAQAAIGPGIAIFSRYSRVRDADGTDMGVREALMLINQVLDEVLGEQESDFDPETRFATRWFRSYGWNKEGSGLADQLARSSDTSLGALERGGILQTGGGKARLLPPDEMSGEWNALTDDALSIWEATVRLAGVLQSDGADGAARMLVGVQQRVQLDAVKDLGFLLFHEAEKRSDSKTAGYFNALVTSWPDIVAMANDIAAEGPQPTQESFEF